MPNENSFSRQVPQPQVVAAQAPEAVAVTEAQIDAILDEPASMIFFVTDQRHRMHVFARRVLELATPALPATEDSSAGDQLQVEPSGPMSNDDVQDLVSLALREAWQLGQTYWQQADSVRITQQRKSAATHDKFQALIDETRAALATTQPASAKFNAAEDAERLKSVARGLSYNAHSEAVWKHTIHEIATRLETSGYADATHAMRAVMGNPITQENQPVAESVAMRAGDQEPVAWVVAHNDYSISFEAGLFSELGAYSFAKHIGGTARAVPLYTSPVATQGQQLDAKRLMFAMQDIDGFVSVEKDKYDFAVDCMIENGREEPNADDELIGVRRLIDAAISATTPPVAKEG